MDARIPVDREDRAQQGEEGSEQRVSPRPINGGRPAGSAATRRRVQRERAHSLDLATLGQVHVLSSRVRMGPGASRGEGEGRECDKGAASAVWARSSGSGCVRTFWRRLAWVWYGERPWCAIVCCFAGAAVKLVLQDEARSVGRAELSTRQKLPAQQGNDVAALRELRSLAPRHSSPRCVARLSTAQLGLMRVMVIPSSQRTAGTMLSLTRQRPPCPEFRQTKGPCASRSFRARCLASAEPSLDSPDEHARWLLESASERRWASSRRSRRAERGTEVLISAARRSSSHAATTSQGQLNNRWYGLELQTKASWRYADGRTGAFAHRGRHTPLRFSRHRSHQAALPAGCTTLFPSLERTSAS